MRLLLLLPVLFLCLFRPASAYDVSELEAAGLFDEFEPDRLTPLEKKFLQTGLAFQGLYEARIDGVWGNGSQKALSRYAADLGFIGRIPKFAAFMLAWGTDITFVDNAWGYLYLDFHKISALIPAKYIDFKEDNGKYLKLIDKKSSLKYELTRSSWKFVPSTHKTVLTRFKLNKKPYVLRKDGLWITSVEFPNGERLYVRSDNVGGAWTTVMISIERGDEGLLAAAAGSIIPGKAPRLFLFDGYLKDGVYTTYKFIKQHDDGHRLPGARDRMSNPLPDEGRVSPPEAKAPVPAEDSDTKTTSSGTGFAVSANGDILTNDHVAAGCSRLTVNGHEAVLKATDKTFDLALVRVPALRNTDFATFADKPAPLNSDITVAGYPLSGLLSGLNVTRGSVTAMKGIGGDSTRMQISAPVQPGNSGGPAMNAQGQVVGVVVAKLDAQLVANAIGDIPQNVNFAVRGSMAKLFLHQNGITPRTASPGSSLPPETIATRLSGITHYIECY